MRTLTVKELASVMKLELLIAAADMTRLITVADVNRPGLVLTGYADYYDTKRVQLMGHTELAFLAAQGEEIAYKRWHDLTELGFPCLVVSAGQELPSSWLQRAAEKKLPVLRSKLATTAFLSRLSTFLEERLAPRTTVHAVLVDVSGMGIMITGDSGIGKSETALELIKRGHRLVADDAVEITRSEENILTGRAPEVLRHVMEVRGLGILDVSRLFGISAVRSRHRIHMIVNLEEWQDGRYYDRLGVDEETREILGVKLPCKTVPVRPGRNISSIIEVAAMNQRLKETGYDGAREFISRQQAFCQREE